MISKNNADAMLFQKPEILSLRSNEILTAVIHGARKEEPSAEVQLAAIHALYNSLEFVRENFEREVCFFLIFLIRDLTNPCRESEITSCRLFAKPLRMHLYLSKWVRLSVWCELWVSITTKCHCTWNKHCSGYVLFHTRDFNLPYLLVDGRGHETCR